MPAVWKDTITKNVTKVTESQVTDMRTKVNACLLALGKFAKTWNKTILKHTSLIEDHELNEIKGALDDAYNGNYYCTIDFTTANTGVQASHYDSYCVSDNVPDNGTNLTNYTSYDVCGGNIA
jgi:hypothetical protein